MRRIWLSFHMFAHVVKSVLFVSIHVTNLLLQLLMFFDYFYNSFQEEKTEISNLFKLPTYARGFCLKYGKYTAKWTTVENQIHYFFRDLPSLSFHKTRVKE